MVTSIRAWSCLLLVPLAGGHLSAQTLSAALDLTASYSGEEIRAAASRGAVLPTAHRAARRAGRTISHTVRDLQPQRPATSGGELATILLVENDDRVRALVAHMLKKQGYKVLLASADQALQIAAGYHGPIHLLLTDLALRSLGGRGLAERLAVTRPQTPVIFMSNCLDDEVLRDRAKKAGAGVIHKPFSIDALAHELRETLSTGATASTRG